MAKFTTTTKSVIEVLRELYLEWLKMGEWIVLSLPQVILWQNQLWLGVYHPINTMILISLQADQ